MKELRLGDNCSRSFLGALARRVSEGESDGDEFQDASEALVSQPSLEASCRTI